MYKVLLLVFTFSKFISSNFLVTSIRLWFLNFKSLTKISFFPVSARLSSLTSKWGYILLFVFMDISVISLFIICPFLIICSYIIIFLFILINLRSCLSKWLGLKLSISFPFPYPSIKFIVFCLDIIPWFLSLLLFFIISVSKFSLLIMYYAFFPSCSWYPIMVLIELAFFDMFFCFFLFY